MSGYLVSHLYGTKGNWKMKKNETGTEKNGTEKNGERFGKRITVVSIDVNWPILTFVNITSCVILRNGWRQWTLRVRHDVFDAHDVLTFFKITKNFKNILTKIDATSIYNLVNWRQLSSFKDIWRQMNIEVEQEILSWRKYSH